MCLANALFKTTSNIVASPSNVISKIRFHFMSFSTKHISRQKNLIQPACSFAGFSSGAEKGAKLQSVDI